MHIQIRCSICTGKPQKHFISLVYIATGLVQSLGYPMDEERVVGGKMITRSCEENTAMRDRLHKWVISMVRSTHKDDLDHLLHLQMQVSDLHVNRSIPAELNLLY